MTALPKVKVLPEEVINCTSHWVSEALKDEIQNWVHYSPILIHAPTGRGKNKFIMDCLIPYAESQGKKVLLISNRRILNAQQRNDVWEVVGNYSSPKYTVEQKERMGNAIVITYQSLSDQKLKEIWEDRANIGYIVFDETHFFLSDATINPDTMYILQSLIFNMAKSSIRIYMSATPEEILPVIESAERNHLQKNYDPIRSKELSFIARFLIYRFEADYSHYNFSFFSEWEDLVDFVSRDDPSNKWLIFVRTIDEGHILKQRFKILKEKVAFIDASTRNRAESNGDLEAYLTIQRRECFNERILIATPVLDNGININDAALKHIVIHSFDRTGIIQVMGRKRIQGEEIVNVHFKLLNELAEINKDMTSIKQLLSCVNEFRKNNEGFWETRWGKLTGEMQSLFRVELFRNSVAPHEHQVFAYESPIPDIELIPVGANCNITINLLGEHKLNLMLASFERLEDIWYKCENEKLAFPQLLSQWLPTAQGLEKTQNIMAQRIAMLETFRGWIMKQADIVALAEEKTEEMKEGEKSALELFYDEFLNEAKGLFKYKLRGKKEKGRKTSDIQAILEELKIPLELCKKDHVWKFRKTSHIKDNGQS